MRLMRPHPVRKTASVAAGAAALAAVATFGAFVALPAAAGAATTPSAQAEYEAALKAAGSQGVHFASSASQGTVTIRVTGDTGTTSGAQTLTVKKGNLTEQVSALLVGSMGYVKGNATALHNVIGLSSSLSRKYAGTWLSFPTSNSSLAQLVAGLLNSQVSNELQMSGPYSYGTATTVGSQHVLAVHGTVSTQSGSKVPVVLYVAATGSPLPAEEVTNPGTTGGSSAIHGTVAFSHWGEKTKEKAPSHSVSLLKLVPSASSGATTTTSGATSTTAG
jgi:hypothetical protein